jgi:hypothetical protein
MMNRNLLPVAAIALLTLAACSKSEPEVVDSRAADPMAAQLANAAPVELPPAIKASVSLRCADNSLAFVDFFDGDKLANFRTERAAPPVRLTAPAAGEPFVAEGYVLTGTASAISITQPGKAAVSCKA